MFSSLQDFITEPKYTDVTLVCDDQFSIQAHKAVLSASSPVFRNILTSHPQDNTVIYLEDVNQFQLQQILQFLCLGEVKIEKDQIGAFMDIVKNWEINTLNFSFEGSARYSNTNEDIRKTFTPGINPLEQINESPSSEMNCALHEQGHVCRECNSVYANKGSLFIHTQN